MSHATVYADWLEEEGDTSQAEFIRMQRRLRVGAWHFRRGFLQSTPLSWHRSTVLSPW